MRIFRRTTQLLICTTLILLHTACSAPQNEAKTPLIIPIPLSQIIDNSVFTIDSNTQLSYDIEFKQVAELLKTFIEEGSPIQLKDTESKHKISFTKDTTIKDDERYRLKITEQGITIFSNSQKGAFYALQSLRQLLPDSFEDGTYDDNSVAVQSLEIEDAPQFKYRGMHLDVGRHMYSVDFIKKYIDLMAMLKMNTFHWHLTEDQGWRIEIKKYPKLQDIAAYRKETLIGHYSSQPHQFDGKRYGGFYTQEQIKEIVAYATTRQVTVIPEIEMPGHSQAAIAAYPELGCTGKQVEVATKWGVFEEVYCPSEKTFKFLEDVIDEVVALFPGKYIHIGGDEAPKTRWKNCKHCQQLIRKEGLKDEHGLQSYFISRMEKYINSKGKQIIGWDEILEGGLAPNATVMSWRGTNGAVQAAKEHHDVILTPGSHCYFDHYQSDNENEPVAIGGFLPLEKVYSFNPIPKELNEEESKYVLGAQGNVWTEYMKTSEKVEYMAFPRMVALSEVVWSSTESRDYENFKTRLIEYQKRLDVLKVNYANHLYELSGKLDTENNSLLYSLKASSNDKFIRYTLDGSEPNINSERYTKPISIEKTTTIKAASFDKAKQLSSLFTETVQIHKAIGKKISLNVEPNARYNAGGKKALINGISGSTKRYGDKEWLGFWGDDVEIVIDLGEKKKINSISTRFHNGNGQWIYAPQKIEIILDENSYNFNLEKKQDLLYNVHYKFNASSRYVRVNVSNFGVIPDGKQGAGNKAWTFIDEIIIE
ncbi:MAG: family 20 glycosylhydrolase [Flavobacteriaceae bacterium]